ncbi:MAG TPA: 6-carboxytetrahydropterin synthase [Bacteroidales bacterium]|nr:6-carboxytetrahydropterin synthase [Bacteroidales bacterium]
MNHIRVTKEFTFEMAHALWNYDGACKNIHGHSYKLLVTIIGQPSIDEDNQKFGMVIDFKDLKSIVKSTIIEKLDHSLVVYQRADKDDFQYVKKLYEKVHVFDFQPTCENLVVYCANQIQKRLPRHIMLHSIKLYETATSYAEWHRSDN